MKLIIIFVICTLHLICAKVPNGYVDPSNIKKYDRGRYSSFRQHNGENTLDLGQNSCECEDKDCKHYENDVSMLHSYHKRMINRLVNTLHFNGNNYLLKLNTVVMEEQLQILKDYGQSEEFNYDSLREVDDLISDILYQAKSTFDYDSIKQDWIYYFKLFLTTQNIIIIAVSCVVYMTYRLIHIRFSILRAIGLFIFVFLIIGFGWTWHDLVEEEEIKLMAQRMQYPIPPECNAAEMTWYQRWFSKSSVDCEKFVRAHNKKATLSITPQKVFSEMFGQSISHILGHVINTMVQFITKMHESLPFPFNYLSLPFLLIFVLLLIVLLVIILSGVRLKLGILNIFNVEIGSSSYRSRNYIDEHRPYLQQISQQRRQPANILDHDDEMQLHDRRPLLKSNNSCLQVQGAKPLDKNTNCKKSIIEKNENIVREDASCQTELINNISQSQLTNDHYEKIENISVESTDQQNSHKNDDKSHGDYSLNNSLDLNESTRKKLEIGNGDTGE